MDTEDHILENLVRDIEQMFTNPDELDSYYSSIDTDDSGDDKEIVELVYRDIYGNKSFIIKNKDDKYKYMKINNRGIKIYQVPDRSRCHDKDDDYYIAQISIPGYPERFYNTDIEKYSHVYFVFVSDNPKIITPFATILLDKNKILTKVELFDGHIFKFTKEINNDFKLSSVKYPDTQGYVKADTPVFTLDNTIMIDTDSEKTISTIKLYYNKEVMELNFINGVPMIFNLMHNEKWFFDFQGNLDYKITDNENVHIYYWDDAVDCVYEKEPGDTWKYTVYDKLGRVLDMNRGLRGHEHRRRYSTF